VQLPRSATGDAVQVIFSVDAASLNKNSVNGRGVASDDAIKLQADQELAQHPDLRAVIQADGDVPHRRVIHVMDLLSQAHVSNIDFAVDLSAPQEPPAP